LGKIYLYIQGILLVEAWGVAFLKKTFLDKAHD